MSSGAIVLLHEPFWGITVAVTSGARSGRQKSRRIVRDDAKVQGLFWTRAFYFTKTIALTFYFAALILTPLDFALAVRQVKATDAMFVIVSDVNLDKPQVSGALRRRHVRVLELPDALAFCVVPLIPNLCKGCAHSTHQCVGLFCLSSNCIVLRIPSLSLLVCVLTSFRATVVMRRTPGGGKAGGVVRGVPVRPAPAALRAHGKLLLLAHHPRYVYTCACVKALIEILLLVFLV